ncbi:MAG: hypothetical protein NT066_06405, partial [Candidatus Omnitrophica bacterium]|nr:hypothetical protein [Candidatus Omnitrophota bacterium]
MKVKELAALRFAVILIICLTSSYSITYTAIHNFSNQHAGIEKYPDTEHYLAMYRGQLVSGIFRFRILVPSLARILPDPPRWLF